MFILYVKIAKNIFHGINYKSTLTSQHAVLHKIRKKNNYKSVKYDGLVAYSYSISTNKFIQINEEENYVFDRCITDWNLKLN